VITELGRNVRECHDKLRTLIGAIAKTGADRLTQAEAARCRTSVERLAVNLDDAIDDEERRLFPTIPAGALRDRPSRLKSTELAKGAQMKRGILLLLGLLFINATGIATADEVAQGRAMYLQYCASCHGLNGEGNGPMARTLTTPPANLRRLSERYGNPLPEDQIARFIDGRADVKAHGLRDMPVWGKRLYSEGQGSERQVKDLIAKLVAYLQSIQTGVRNASRR
jgi:mono/diheme cytochrome c family protein